VDEVGALLSKGLQLAGVAAAQAGTVVRSGTAQVNQLLHRWLLVGIALARGRAAATSTATLTLVSSVHGVLLRVLGKGLYALSSPKQQ